MVSPIPTPIPVSLGILFWKPGAAELPQPRVSRSGFLQGTPFSICISLFPSFLSLFSFFNRMHYPPPPPLDLSRRADLPRRYFPRRVPNHVHPYFFASSLVPRCSQRLMLNPYAGKTLPGVSPALGAGAEPPWVRTPCNQLYSLFWQANCNRGT